MWVLVHFLCVIEGVGVARVGVGVDELGGLLLSLFLLLLWQQLSNEYHAFTKILLTSFVCVCVQFRALLVS